MACPYYPVPVGAGRPVFPGSEEDSALPVVAVAVAGCHLYHHLLLHHLGHLRRHHARDLGGHRGLGPLGRVQWVLACCLLKV